MESKLKILCLEDDPEDAKIIEHFLKKDNIAFSLKRVDTKKDFLSEFTHEHPDIILADYNIPTFNGLAALATVRETDRITPFILVSGTVGEEVAIQALKNGANDYLLKDRLSRLGVSIRRTLQEVESVKERERHVKEIAWLASFPERNPLPVIEMSLDGNLTYVNPVAFELFPNLAEAKLEHPLFHGLEKFFSGKEEMELLQREVEIGNTVYHQTIHSLRDQKRLRFYLIDISERKNLERLKDEFVGNVSHEMRTPLTIIKGVVENMLDDPDVPPVGEQLISLKIAEANCNRLTKIIVNLLDLSRFEAGKSKLVTLSVDLHSLFSELLQHFELRFKETSLCVTSEIADDLPLVLADPDLVVQVLTNLLDNALRFAKSKITIKAEVMVDEKKRGDQIKPKVLVSVFNDGEMIEPQYLDRIFSKFFQVSRPLGEGYHGTGLGLAICREIINWHNGEIWVENRNPSGVTFCFTLPSA